MKKEDMKIWFWGLLDIFIAVAIIGSVFFAIPMISKWKDSFYPVRTITVAAEGKTTATPDLAELSFSVVSQGKNPADLDTANNDKMTAVITFVKSEGIDDKDITTTAYDLSPNYQYDTQSNRNYVTGYTLTQTVEVKVRDLTKVASVIGGLTPLGVNQIGDVNFTFDDPDVPLAAARADALVKAKAKAMAMASEAGVSLGEVMNVGENSIVPVYQPYPRAVSAGMSVSTASVPTIEPGTQDITDDVTITYALR
jgi:uncharacterized protein YggE